MADEMGYTGELTCVHQVRDLDASIRWYEGALGFRLLVKVEEIGWCEVVTSIEGVTIGLSQVEEPGRGGGAVLTFSVEDVEAARSRLEAMDVPFDGPTQEVPGLVKLATLYDPDGNAFMLAQSLRGGGAS
ncbi:MAG: VOC family protein [Planctomycetota bacterium]|jgi:catechol 2,3-dioxygenase-like lactoylglutathione lyase family enzyme